MTNKEFAIAIAEKIIALEIDRASMVGILNAAILPDGSKLEWRSLLAEHKPLVEGLGLTAGKYELLQRLADTPDDCTTLLSTIHRYMETGE